MLQLIGDEQGLVMLEHRCFEPPDQVILIAVRGHGQALCRADIETGIALDAKRVRKSRLDIAIQATFDFLGHLFRIETQLNLFCQLLESHLQ